jgi:hypothetical protein
MPKENYGLEIIDDQIKEFTNVANRATNLWIQYLLVNRQFSLIHSAGIEFEGKGIIFPAFGGAGKTTLISEFRKFGNVKFFGDDYVIVDRDGYMYSYPSDLSVYYYHLNLFPELRNTQFEEYLTYRNRKKKVQMIEGKVPGIGYIKYIYRKYGSNFSNILTKPIHLLPFHSSNWDLDYIKFPVNNCFHKESIGTHTKLKSCIFLSRYNGTNLKIEKISKYQLVNEIIGILNIEFRYSLIFFHLLNSFGLMDITRFQLNQRDILDDCFSNVHLYRMSIPIKMEHHQFSKETIKLILNNI